VSEHGAQPSCIIKSYVVCSGHIVLLGRVCACLVGERRKDRIWEQLDEHFEDEITEFPHDLV